MISGNTVTVRYDSGPIEQRAANQVRAFDWGIGTPVWCTYLSSPNGQAYPGRITQMKGERVLQITYGDGRSEWKTGAACRSN